MISAQPTRFDLDCVAQAAAWRDAAIADGWSIEPTYGASEPVERAARLRREGFSAQILTRLPVEGDRNQQYTDGSVHLWGPDGLAVNPGRTYDWAKLNAGLTTCSACKATDVPTERVGFAGRVCAACLPAQRRAIETPGWCD